MNEKHPDLAELDALRTGEGTPEAAAHVARCAECKAAVSRIAQLAERLKDAAPPPPGVPMLLRAKILHRAARQIRRTPAWKVFAPLAAAAALLVGFAIYWFATHEAPPASGIRVAARPDDVDGNGAVDILDAYKLSLQIKSGQGFDAKWDFNKDGAVDKGDVDEIARRGVSLTGRDR